MKIKTKGTNNIKEINPAEWSLIEKNGNSSEYEIIERNTIWAAPMNSNGEIVESNKREFELSHWHNMLDLGSKNKWRKIEIDKHEIKETKTEIKKHIKHEKVTRDKIFISHSSKDIEIVNLFVEKILRLGLNIEHNRIFCSSIKGLDIKSGEYIPDRLKTEINSASISLLFISENYKKSEVCINEIGASWVALEKDCTIPLLFPDIGFDKIGFLNLNRLGLKILKEDDLIKLIEDIKIILNINYNLNILNAQIKSFIIEAEKLTKSFITSKNEKKILSEWDQCFKMSLYPFNEILAKSLPTLNSGIHKISDKKTQNRLLFNLSNSGMLDNMWFRFAGGDDYLRHLTKLKNGNWTTTGFNWELNVSDIWVSFNPTLQNEFILIKSEGLELFNITSDVGGKENSVGVLNNGIIVSHNEMANGFAEVNNEVINLEDFEVQRRMREEKSNWIFIGTNYHKIGNNPDEAIDFCEKLDNGTIEANRETIRTFLRNLRSHNTVVKYQ
jgi:hypothetical protein